VNEEDSMQVTDADEKVSFRGLYNQLLASITSQRIHLCTALDHKILEIIEEMRDGGENKEMTDLLGTVHVAEIPAVRM
jgi:hypothetical protein